METGLAGSLARALERGPFLCCGKRSTIVAVQLHYRREGELQARSPGIPGIYSFENTIDMELAPVILFVYNRPEHTRICLEHLEQNKLAAESELYIFADGAKPGGEEAVAAVRRVVSRPWKFRRVTVVERPENRGLAANVIDGVTTEIGRAHV